MRVSIIIPSYNHSNHIGESIQSVLNQDWPDIDLIVIDDGSSDDSPKIIRQMLKDRDDCTFIARENRGLINTLNEGIALAQGEVLCSVASDDYLLPGSLRSRAEYLKNHPECVAVFADGIHVTGSEETSEPLISDKVRQLFSVDDPIPSLIQGVSVPLHTMMARTEIVREIGAFDTRFQICEDLDIQLRLFLAGRVDLIDHKVNAYRHHGANISATLNKRFCVDWVLCYRKYLYEMPQLNAYRGLIRTRLTRKYRALGKYLNRAKQGSDFEVTLFCSGWSFAWRDPRLLWQLVRWQVQRVSKQ